MSKPIIETNEQQQKQRRNTQIDNMAVTGLERMINDLGVGFGEKEVEFSAPGAAEAATPIPSQLEQAAARPTPRPMGIPSVRPPSPAPAAAPAKIVRLGDRVFTTGRLKCGKDYTLNRLGHAIVGFADPIYALQELFFGDRDKSLPGARKLLQTLGQWGRGLVSPEYPINIGRAMFLNMMRFLSQNGELPEGYGVNWEDYGKSSDLWVNAVLARIEGNNGKIGVSNVRFDNELAALSRVGFTHLHVMCSPETWAKRLKEVGMSPNAPELNDTSERLAIRLDNDVMAQIKKSPVGPKLRVLWSDDLVMPPSKRFLTYADLGIN